MTDSDLRYVFACPSCAGSFSISLERIPPVRARFRCPKCGSGMDFPSREEARVYVLLKSTEAEAEPVSTPAPSAAPPPPTPPTRAAPPPVPEAPAPDVEKRYRVEKTGFENDSYDRRAMRNLIRTGAVNEIDSVRFGEGDVVRAGDIPELKSLFELRKSMRGAPPPVCRKHTDLVAHYVCGDTGRPLCEECAPEKKFGGTSVRVCEHCSGTARELAPEPEP